MSPPIEPMLARLVRDMPRADGLRYEPKWDGFRALAVRRDDEVELWSRHTRPLARYFPEIVERIASLSPGVRAGKVLVDWLQNDWRRSTVAPYSLRAGAYPTVSMPLDWGEIRDAVEKRFERHLSFGPRRALERLDREGDAFADVQTLRQELPAL